MKIKLCLYLQALSIHDPSSKMEVCTRLSKFKGEREFFSGVLLYLRELQVEFGRETLAGSTDMGSWA